MIKQMKTTISLTICLNLTLKRLETIQKALMSQPKTKAATISLTVTTVLYLVRR